MAPHTYEGGLMRKLTIAALAAAALAAPPTAPAQSEKDTGPPENPGCFGEFASTGAQTGLAGEFVRANAQRYKGNDGESIGEVGVPFLKSLSCPGDYRGRDSLGEQP
jgi:hypothetical protein